MDDPKTRRIVWLLCSLGCASFIALVALGGWLMWHYIGADFGLEQWNQLEETRKLHKQGRHTEAVARCTQLIREADPPIPEYAARYLIAWDEREAARQAYAEAIAAQRAALAELKDPHAMVEVRLRLAWLYATQPEYLLSQHCPGWEPLGGGSRWHNLPRAVAELEDLLKGEVRLTRDQERRARQFLAWSALLTGQHELAAVCVQKAFGLTEPLPPDAHLFAVDWAWLDQPDQFQQWLREQRKPRGTGEVTGRVLFNGKPATGITVLVAPRPPTAKGDRETVRIQRYNAACRLNVTEVPDGEPGAVHGDPRDEDDPDPAAHRGGASAVTGADGRYTLRHLAPGHYVFIILINTHLDPVCPDDYEVDSTKTFGPTVPLAVALAQAVRLPDLEIYRCYPFNLTCPTDRQVLTTTRPTFRWTAPLRTQDIRYQVIIVETPFTQTARDEKGYEVRGQSWTYEPAPPQRPILKIGRNYRVFVWAMDTQGRRREMATASFSLAPKDRAAAAQADNLAVWPVLMPDPQENQKPAERIQALQEALTNHPHTTYRGLLHDFLGHLYWQTGDQNRARQEFAKVRQECPDWNIGRCAAAALADLQAGRPPRELDEYIERLAPKGKPEPSRSDRR